MQKNLVTMATVESNGSAQNNNDFADGAFGDAAKSVALQTYSENGDKGKAYLVQNASGFGMRKVIEIVIDNTDANATDQILRIGGLAAQPGAAEKFGLAAGASDDPYITDQYGLGCKFTQGFGLMVNKGVYIRDFQVLADADNAPQLRQKLVRRRIFFNGDNTPISDPAAFTFEMSDQRKNMLKDRQSVFYLNDLNWFEYTILKNFKGSVLFEVVSADLTAVMNLLG